jgi:beta-galactosidase
MKTCFRRTSLLVSLPILLLFCAPAILAQDAGTSVVSSGRERLFLNRGWLFHEGDIPFPVVIGHQPSYDNAKAGSSSGAASPEYDDSSWGFLRATKGIDPAI